MDDYSKLILSIGSAIGVIVALVVGVIRQIGSKNPSERSLSALSHEVDILRIMLTAVERNVEKLESDLKVNIEKVNGIDVKCAKNTHQ